MFWSWLGSFLAGPLLGKALDAYKAKLAAGNTEDGIRADLAAKEVTLQQRELELQTQYRIAEIGHWYEPDKIIGLRRCGLLRETARGRQGSRIGDDRPLAGWAETTANLIDAFYFAKRGFENVARIIKK